jgi:hypothetical protein
MSGAIRHVGYSFSNFNDPNAGLGTIATGIRDLLELLEISKAAWWKTWPGKIV